MKKGFTHTMTPQGWKSVPIVPEWYKIPPETPEPAAGPKPAEGSEPKTLTVPQAAKVLGLGLTTTKLLIKSGELASILSRRRRLVRPEAIEKFLANREAGKRGSK